MTTQQQSQLHKKTFLEMFRRTGNVSQSAAAAGIQRSTAWRWQEHDEAFAAEYREAELEATETLEAEAHRRAVFGVPKYKGVYYKGQLIEVVEEREYSDTLLIFLLKARAPEKYRERWDVTSGGQPLIKTLSTDDLALLELPEPK